MPREITLTAADAAQLQAELDEAGLGDASAVADGDEVVVTVPDDLDGEAVDRLTSRHFPVSLLDDVTDAPTRAALEKVLSIVGVSVYSPPDSTPPTLVSAVYSFPIVTVTFSEEIQATNYATGVTISDDFDAQVIESATRQPGDPTKVDFDMGAPDFTGLTLTLFYSSVTGDYRDMANNPLEDIDAGFAVTT